MSELWGPVLLSMAPLCRCHLRDNRNAHPLQPSPPFPPADRGLDGLLEEGLLCLKKKRVNNRQTVKFSLAVLLTNLLSSGAQNPSTQICLCLVLHGVTVWVEDVDIAPGEAQSSAAWTEERCEELWDRVEGVRHKLTRILNPVKLTPYLRQCKVIDEQDEDEVLNSTQYPLRISKAGRLLDILRGQDEEGPEGLTQFLLLEVRKLREQLRNSRMCERRLSQRCRMAEEERSRAERKAQELRHDRLQLERLRQDWESASRELGKLKDRHLEQAVKYSRALEEQGKASTRERDLLRQVEELKSRLTEADKQTVGAPENTTPAKRNSLLSNGVNGSPPALPEKPLQRTEVQKAKSTETQMRKPVPATGVIALMDILQQDRREASEQRQELCDVITRLQGELQSTEEQRDK
ncbi:caspase recruitment domain-containing protein 10-like protein, partial [Lates japonicus]